MITRVADELFYLRAIARAGLIRPEPPQNLFRAASAIVRWGSLGSATVIGAIRHPDRVAIVDELGELTYGELDARANALANAWIAHGLRPGDGVAILARNHRGFLEATAAVAKSGGRAIYLNTDFAGPQIREVAEGEGAQMLIHDDEYASLIEGFEPRLGRWRAWLDRDDVPPADSLDGLIAGGDRSPPPKPGRTASVVILTSGTTGAPRGAPREAPRGLQVLGALLSMVPFRAREVTVDCAPMFHALGFAHAVVGLGLGSTIVMRRRFDPEWALDAIERRGATALILVPVMLQRILALGPEAIAARDLSSLRIIFVAGSQLGAELCTEAMRVFGPIVYNLYGSTEVSYATIATPDDLRAEPGCVGRPPRGAVVKILDENGAALPRGEIGRIFVGNASAFEGYTDGETKEMIDGLMSTGDLGHLDGAGRLFVDGRNDEMIVSGGENVFPLEIEELLLSHHEIVEAAAIGVDDPDFGQRLRVFVVAGEGARLSEDDVKAYVRENLARYKVPREVVFCESLPRNPTGKILKRQLAISDAAGGRT